MDNCGFSFVLYEDVSLIPFSVNYAFIDEAVSYCITLLIYRFAKQQTLYSFARINIPFYVPITETATLTLRILSDKHAIKDT